MVLRSGTAGAAIVDALVAAGVDHAFTVPGESFLGALAVLRDDSRVRLVSTRHESGAAFMAEAYGKLTRRPALCMATRTVGAANLAIGVHTAHQDSTPLIAVLGQVPRMWRHREAFQESDLAAMFGPLTKWSVEIDDPERAGELAYRAAQVAIEGRPGPVALILPEDILDVAVTLPDRPALSATCPQPDARAVVAALQLLRNARRPAILVGAGVLAADATRLVVDLAEREEVGVFTSWRRPDAFPNDHRLYFGQTGLSAPPCVPERLRDADALLVIGCRLNELTTFGYTAPAPGARWAHVDLEPAGMSADSTAEVTIRADAAAFLVAAAELAAGSPLEQRPARIAANEADRRRWCEETTPHRGVARQGFADQQAIAGHLRRLLPENSIVVTDAGNFSGWGARYLRWNRPGTFLGPTSGAMGYAVPAAIGAKLARPDRPVVALAGDGGFLMTACEIETAVRERAPFVSVVFDNCQYGTIRMHQEKRFPGARVGTDLGPVDFAGLSSALGASAVRIDDADDFPDAFCAALESGVATTIAVRVDPEQLSVAADATASMAGGG